MGVPRLFVAREINLCRLVLYLVTDIRFLILFLKNGTILMLLPGSP